MQLVDRVKRLVAGPDEEGIVLQCTNCGETFDEPQAACPVCGEDEIKEKGSFQFRPKEE